MHPTRVVLRLLSTLTLCVGLVVVIPCARADQTLPRGQWPLAPRPTVVRRFEPPASTYGAGHRGVDLLGRPGQRVRVALAGTVSFAGTLAGKGVVSVRHGDLRTTYEPVTATVHVGDRVAAGEVIGVLQVGPSHCHPRHCLHWGLLRGSRYLDPLLLVGGGPVRLLPTAGGAPVARTPARADSLVPSRDSARPGAAAAVVAAARSGLGG